MTASHIVCISTQGKEKEIKKGSLARFQSIAPATMKTALHQFASEVQKNAPPLQFRYSGFQTRVV